MSLIDGPTLEDELRAKGPLDPLTVAGIGLDLCGALDAVHRAGVVHHDVKAQNVMRAADGRIVLADFGAGSDALELGTATAGDLAGTPLYLAPEVLREASGIAAERHLQPRRGAVPSAHRIVPARRPHDRRLAPGSRRRRAPPGAGGASGCPCAPVAHRRSMPGAQSSRSISGRRRRCPGVARRQRTRMDRAARADDGHGRADSRRWFVRALAIRPKSPAAAAGPASTSADSVAAEDPESRLRECFGRWPLPPRRAFVQDLASGVQRRWRPESENGGAGTRAGDVAGWDTDCLRVVHSFPAVRAASRAAELRKHGGIAPAIASIQIPTFGCGRRIGRRMDNRSSLRDRVPTALARSASSPCKMDLFAALAPIDWRGSTAFFSPDGRTFAFDVPASDTESQRDIFVMPIDGSDRIPAVVGPANDVLMGWSPDGNYLLFASNRSGTTDLWAAPLSNRGAPGIPERLKAGIGNVRSVGMTNAGSLYFRTPANEVDVELASIDLSSGRRVGAPARPPQSVPGTNLEPAWSPDGKQLAYVSKRAGDDLAGTIAIYTVTMRELRELAPLRLAWAQGLSWAPDGRSLALTAVDLKGRCGLFRVDVNTGDVSPIAYPIPLTYQGPHWSPDGKRLYFQPINNEAIYEWDTTTGRQRTIRSAELAKKGPISVSPDGRWIASYERPSDLLQAVVIRAVDGGESREIFRLPDGELDVIPMPWTPTSDAIIVRKYAEPRQSIHSRRGVVADTS